MEFWQIALIVALAMLGAAAAVAFAYAQGRAAGREQARDEMDADPDNHSLFGDEVPVRPTERRLVETLSQALIVVDNTGYVRYASPGSMPFGLVDGQRLDSGEVLDILSQVRADGHVREREIRLAAGGHPAVPSNGRGLEAGQTMPSNTLYLKVRVGAIDETLYAILISDVSEQRRFEAVRRDFVTNVSHELKTPAGAIALLAETVTDAADDPDAVRYFSGRIAKESARLTELVHHLIDLQKAQSAQGMTDARRIPAIDVVRDAIAANQVQADAHHIDIRLSVNGESVPLAADAPSLGPMIVVNKEAMVTAVKNLVENAIHYSPERTTVAVGVGKSDGGVTIRVVDQGIGIPAKSLDRVFERFYRVDPARSRETGGSGLGLAITKHCVQENGGSIAVWSHEGEGSTFTIELPAAPDDEDEASNPQ